MTPTAGVSRHASLPGSPVHAPQYAVPQPAGQQCLPGELPWALLVPAVDALALTCDTIGGLEGGRLADLRILVSGWADLRTTRQRLTAGQSELTWRGDSCG